MRRNICIHPCFVIAWSRCFPQSVGQQHLCADGLKAVPTSHPLGQFHHTVETFGVSGSVPIGEVVEDGIAVVFDGQRKRQEGVGNIGGDLCKPGKVALQRIFLSRSFIDGVKVFFQAIGYLQLWEVPQPCLKNQGFAFIQIMRSPQQQEPIMHQGSPLFVGQALSYLLADGFQASREQFENVKLVYYQFGMWQDLMHRSVIRRPHVCANHRDALLYLIRQLAQVTEDRFFGAIPKQVNNGMVLDIDQDTAILTQQVQFINAQSKNACLWNTRLQVRCELVKERTNGRFSQTNFIGNTYKGSSECLVLNVRHQASRHGMTFVHVWKWLVERATTGTATIAAALNTNPNTLCTNGQVHKQLWSGFMTVQLGMLTVDTLKRRNYQFHLNMKIIVMFFSYKDAKISQAQEVQGQFSKCRVLPMTFSAVRVKVVAREGRLLQASYRDSTRYLDVGNKCRSVKSGTIPRDISISQSLIPSILPPPYITIHYTRQYKIPMNVRISHTHSDENTRRSQRNELVRTRENITIAYHVAGGATTRRVPFLLSGCFTFPKSGESSYGSI